MATVADDSAGTVLLLVATIGKPLGVRGQVTVRLHTDEPGKRLTKGTALTITPPGVDQPGPDVVGQSRLTLTSVRIQPPGAVLSLEGVSDRDQAERLRGHLLWSEAAAGESPNGADEFYDHQLIGTPCSATTGESLGHVVEVAHHPAHDNLVVRNADGDHLVPFVRAIVPSVTSDEIMIDDPGGLFDSPISGGVRRAD